MSESKPTVHVATDHAGLAHKEVVKEWLKGEGYEVVDHGSFEFDPLDDFTDAILPAAKAVSQAPKENRAIIFGGSGQGEAMIANRFPHVRATVFYGGNVEIIRLSRTHNDANILSIGARFVGVDEAKREVWNWLHIPFAGEAKYVRRNREIDTLTGNA
jgi:ribose 5-phosphate isomerase B